MAGFVAPHIYQNDVLIWCGIGLFGVAVLAAQVRLPMEFAAKRRVEQWLLASAWLPDQAREPARGALWWAAMRPLCELLVPLGRFVFWVAVAFGILRLIVWRSSKQNRHSH